MHFNYTKRSKAQRIFTLESMKRECLSSNQDTQWKVTGYLGAITLKLNYFIAAILLYLLNSI